MFYNLINFTYKLLKKGKEQFNKISGYVRLKISPKLNINPKPRITVLC